MLTAMFYNANRGQDSPPLTALDFMYLDPDTAAARHAKKQQQYARNLMDWFSAVAKPKESKAH